MRVLALALQAVFTIIGIRTAAIWAIRRISWRNQMRGWQPITEGDYEADYGTADEQ